MSIRFMGKEYGSVDEMPPQARQRYERMRDEVAKRYPDANADEALMELLMDEESDRGSKQRAWGGRQQKGSAPVPAPFESTIDLGAAQKAYQVKRSSLTGPSVILVISVVMILVALIISANSLPSINFNDLASTKDSAIIGGIFSLIFFGVGGFLLLLSLGNIGALWSGVQSVVAYRDGFAYRSRGRMRAYRWTEIASIVSDEKVHVSRYGTFTTRAYTIQKKSGEKITFDSTQIEDVVSLAKSIKEKTYPLLQATLTQQYNANEAVAFGPVIIHRQNGIRVGGKQLAWGDIMDVKVKQGSLVVTMKDSSLFGGYHTARASTIPNIEVLCELIGVDPTSIELVG